jgi:DNA-binding transcriptional regulator YiaG
MSAITKDKAHEIVIEELGSAREEPLLKGAPSIEATIVFLRILDRCLVRLNRQARLGKKLDVILRETALQRGFPAFLTYSRSSMDRASECVLATWTEAAHLLGKEGVREPQEILCGTGQALTGISEELFRDYLSTYNLAFAEILREHMVEPRAQQTIQELLQGFDLSYDDLGRVLEVSGETVRRWAKGASSVPKQKLAVIDVAGNALRRLLRIIRPEVLPSVVRRPAELFGGLSALDWIRSGRFAEVADRYETTFAYQG